jgi:hypothetical protein
MRRRITSNRVEGAMTADVAAANQAETREMDRKFTDGRLEGEISRKEGTAMSTITELAQKHNETLIRNGIVLGAIDSGHSTKAAHPALTHNHCGWPGIMPTSSSSGVGDIEYWTTPGAFRSGPLERTPNRQP